MSDQSGERVRVDYTNYRGERAIRTITPWGVEWGSTEHHPEPQWLLTCYDHDKLACRTYALRDIHAWNGVPTESPEALSAVPVGSQRGGDQGAPSNALAEARAVLCEIPGVRRAAEREIERLRNEAAGDDAPHWFAEDNRVEADCIEAALSLIAKEEGRHG